MSADLFDTAPFTGGGVVRMEVPLDRIVAGNNDRTRFDDEELRALAASIAEVGLLQVPKVRPRGETFELVYGERRTRACRLLDWTTIPVDVEALSDFDAAMAMLTENTGRVDLDPLDEARAYQKALGFGLTPAAVAAKAGVSVSKVSIRLKLLQLVPEAQKMVQGGSLPIGFYPSMHGLDSERQHLVLRAWAESDGTLNWWQWDALCKHRLEEQNQGAMFDPNAFLQVQEYVMQAKAARTPTAALRKLVTDLLAVLEPLGLAPELIAQAATLGLTPVDTRANVC